MFNRRSFVAFSAAFAASPGLLRAQPYPQRKLPFHLAVIEDEIDSDFEKACHIVAVEFGLKFIEVRSIGKKNIAEVNDDDIAEARRILAKYSLAVSDLASPLFKVTLPGAKVEPGTKVDTFGAPADTFAQQTEVLEKCIHTARSLSTTRIRCFDFLRLEDQKAARPEINEHLRKASTRLAKENMILLLENEQSCNTSTGAEAAQVLAEVTNPNFMLNWDPGNAAASGEVPFPYGYNLLPKGRIGHCHCKDELHNASGKSEWAAVGSGTIDWKGQLQALVKQRFSGTLSLETHWRGAGTPEASTRASMAGLQKILAEVSS